MSNREGGPIQSHDDLRYQRDMLAYREDAWLRRAGWKHTSSGTPGSYWTWQREHEGRLLVCDRRLAISMQAHLEGKRCICEGYNTEPRCPVHGTASQLQDRLATMVALAKECLSEDDYIDSGDAANLAHMVVEVLGG